MHEKDGGTCIGETTKQQECNVLDCPGKYYIPNRAHIIADIAYQFDPSSAIPRSYHCRYRFSIWSLQCNANGAHGKTVLVLLHVEEELGIRKDQNYLKNETEGNVKESHLY